MTRIAAAVAVAIVAVVVVAVAGSGGDEPAKRAPAALPALRKAWTAELAAGSKPLKADVLDSRPHGDLSTWTIGDTLVLLGRGRVTGYDAATGQQRWTLKARVCGASPEPNAAGLGGLLLATERGCRVAALLDTETGKLRWSRDLGGRSPHTANDADVIVTDRTVAVPVGFGGDYRLLDVRSGRGAGAPRGRPDRPVVVGDGVLAMTSGSIVQVLDVDTRERVARAKLAPPAEVDGIVSADPLVLDLSARGHRAYRHLDGPYVGKSMDDEPQLLGVLGDTVVVSYDTTSPLDRTARFYGFDVATGEQRWTTDPARTFVLGRRGDDLLTASLGGPGVADVGPDRTLFALGQAPADDPGGQKLLGTVTVDGSWGLEFDPGWTDDLFLVQTGGELTAYELPQPGERALPQPPAREQAVDLCEAVRPRTLRGLGFRSVDLPPPADCRWAESFEPDGTDRSLLVQAFALGSAENAKRNLGKLRHDETNGFRADAPFPGLGDEAWSDQDRRDGDDRSRLMAREGDLVVIADSRYGGFDPVAHPRGRALLRRQAAAVRDVLTAAAAPAP